MPGPVTKIYLQHFSEISRKEETLEVPSDVLLTDLEDRLRCFSTDLLWFHQGRPLEALPRPLPPRLVLKEGFPRHDWTSWRTPTSWTLPASLCPQSAAAVQLRRASQSPADVGLVCCGFEDNTRGDRWLFASSEVLSRAFTSFTWRRLVLLLCERWALQLYGGAAARRVQLRALRADLESIRVAHDVLLMEDGDAGGLWPFGEESRKEAELIMSAELHKREDSANSDSLYNLAVLLLMQPVKTESDLQQALELLQRSLTHTPSPWAHQLCERLKEQLDVDTREDVTRPSLDPGWRYSSYQNDELQGQASSEEAHKHDEGDEADLTHKPMVAFEEAITRVRSAMQASEDSGPRHEEPRARVEFARSSTVEALSGVLRSLNLRRDSASLPSKAPRCVGAALEQRRRRQLQRAFLGSRHGHHFCRLRRLPVLLHRGTGTSDAVPESSPAPVPPLRVASLETVLHFISVPAEGIHQTDHELCSVLWILLYFGLRRCHPGLQRLRAALSATPVPACLRIVRHFGYCASGAMSRDSSKNLEEVLLHGLSTIRGDELAVTRGFASDYVGAGLSEEDQLLVLDRRIKLLEMLLATPPKVYLQQGHAALQRNGLASQAPAQTLIRPSAQRGRKANLTRAERVEQLLSKKMLRRDTEVDEGLEVIGIGS
ncbi:kif1 [Symbiodinium natans]|uniref:Kif1 protein n=1 Tax=Symbiodinium natans TaxID=878477 RepID=A0A812QUH9_9DINO|nr:kif1 [Symbiodinium natans]